MELAGPYFGNARSALWTLVILAAVGMAALSANAQTFTVLHNFTGTGRDGANPLAGLVMDRAGNLYGVTVRGGGGPCSSVDGNGCGTVFRMTRSGSAWYYLPLYEFAGWVNNDGASPGYGGLTIGLDGTLYGTTEIGGEPAGCSGSPGCGTVFNLKPSPSRPVSVLSPWTEKILYRFQQVPDGKFPNGKLVFDSLGNLYGTTTEGGAHSPGARSSS